VNRKKLKKHQRDEKSRVPAENIIRKPTKTDLLAAYGKTVPDVIAPRLKILFVGINPGLYSGAVGHHFARPGNRFWPVLYKAGFTERLLLPAEERELLKSGYGITNIVNRSTASAAELDNKELKAGGLRLAVKIKRHRPRIVAVLGLAAFRVAFGQPKAGFGIREEHIGTSRFWILPNPSGLNASYQLPELSRMFREVRIAAEERCQQQLHAGKKYEAEKLFIRETEQS